MEQKTAEDFQQINDMIREVRVVVGRGTSPFYQFTDAQLMEVADTEMRKALLDLAGEFQATAKSLLDTLEHIRFRQEVIKQRQRRRCLTSNNPEPK